MELPCFIGKAAHFDSAICIRIHKNFFAAFFHRKYNSGIIFAFIIKGIIF